MDEWPYDRGKTVLLYYFAYYFITLLLLFCVRVKVLFATPYVIS
jgi:hypothetical protein